MRTKLASGRRYLSSFVKLFLPLTIDLVVFTLAFKIYLSLAKNSFPELLFILLLLSYLVLLVSVALISKMFWNVNIRSLFAVTKPWKSLIVLGAVLAAFSYLVHVVLTLPFSDVKTYQFGAVKEYDYFSIPCLLILLLYAFVGSITEEMVYRGYIQKGLARSHGFGFALITASSVFMVRHIKLFAPLPTPDLLFFFLFFAVLVGYVFHKTGSLFTAISFHTCFNWINILTPITLTVVPSLSFAKYFVNILWWIPSLLFFIVLLRWKRLTR